MKLIGHAPDGWALVQQQARYWLIRPPYRADDRSPLTPKQVERALLHEDFARCDQPFDGWGPLARHLEATLVQQASPEDRQAARTAAARLLRHATAAQAARHLDRIESRVTSSPREAEEALIALLAAPSVQGSPALITRLQGLLERARSQTSSLRTSLAGASARPGHRWPVRNPAQVAARSRRVQQSGQVLDWAA